MLSQVSNLSFKSFFFFQVFLCYTNLMRKDFFTQSSKKKIGQAIHAYYREFGRDLPWRRDPSFYPVWISEIMAQQTRMEVVVSYHQNFMEALPTIQDLADVKEEVLLKLWEGLGYYNRARNLKKAAQEIVYIRKEVPKSYEELLSLPGVGPYTAAAIASIVYGQAYVALDGNLSRIFSRLLAYDGDIGKAQTKEDLTSFGQEIMGPDPSAFNQGLMDIGSKICLPKDRALCPSCPLKAYCLAYQEGSVAKYPVKAPKKERKLVERTIFILVKNGALALKKRPDQGLLRGQWELPGVDSYLDLEDAKALLLERDLPFSFIKKGPSGKHLFSHIEWRMKSYLVQVRDLPFAREDDVLQYFSQEDLDQTIALPSAFKVFVQEWRQENERI